MGETTNILNSNSNITILVNSCDKYQDAWKPFFELLYIQWPECPYKIILNTETKKFSFDKLNVETINFNENGAWSKRLKNVLEKIDTDYIIYFLEDFFLEGPVNIDSLNKAIELIKRDESIGYIGLKYNTEYTFKDEKSAPKDISFINKDDLITYNRINSMTALWRKDWLVSLLKMHESPWEFEKYGSIRSKRSDKKVLIINNKVLPPVFNYSVDIEYGMGIYGGKWLKKNKELFDRYEIDVEFDNLGVFEEASKDKTPNTNKKSDFREFLYKIKHWLKVRKRKINKKIREIKSLY